MSTPTLVIDPTGDHGTPLALCSACPPSVWGWAMPSTADEPFRKHLAEVHPTAPEAVNLPAPMGDGEGGLDLDAMRVAAPQVRDDLVLALRHAATLARQARGTVVVPEDTYPLVRKLTEADEVLRQWGQAFTAAAAEARAIIEEEALTVAGAEADGMLTSSLFVPDGVGQRIAVRADYKAGESTWDVPTLVGWLIDDEASDNRCSCDTGPSSDGPEVDCPQHGDPMTVARDVARNVTDRLLALGRYTPSARAIEQQRKRLAELGRDNDAAVVRQVRSVGQRTYLGVKITREEAK